MLWLDPISYIMVFLLVCFGVVLGLFGFFLFVCLWVSCLFVFSLLVVSTTFPGADRDLTDIVFLGTLFRSLKIKKATFC